MTDLLPVLSQRFSSRAIARMESGAGLEVAEIRAIEAIEIAKAQALGSIAQAGQVEVAHVYAAAFVLAEQHPYAFPALQQLASTTSYEIAQRIHRANRRLG